MKTILTTLAVAALTACTNVGTTALCAAAPYSDACGVAIMEGNHQHLKDVERQRAKFLARNPEAAAQDAEQKRRIESQQRYMELTAAKLQAEYEARKAKEQTEK